MCYFSAPTYLMELSNASIGQKTTDKNSSPAPKPELLPKALASLNGNIIANTMLAIGINSSKNFQPFPQAILNITYAL